MVMDVAGAIPKDFMLLAIQFLIPYNLHIVL